MNVLTNALERITSAHIARILGKTKMAVTYWKTKGLPRSDHLGDTNYWKVIQVEGRKFGLNLTKKDLIDASNELRNS